MIRIYPTYLFAFILVTACGQVEQAPLDQTAEETAVISRLQAFSTALNNGSIDSLTDFYSQDERFYWVEDGNVTYPTHDALKASLSGLFSSLESAKMKVLDTRIELLDEKSASIYLEYEQHLTFKSNFSFDINGAMTALMIKEDKTWRFLIGHSSTKKER